jgi:hypothetical protein
MSWKKGQKLKLVAEDQVQGRTREIYDEIRQRLGVPHVYLMFQALAAYPTFLDLHWHAVGPVTLTQEFFNLGERLRADAYTRMHNYFSVPDLCDPLTGLNFSIDARREVTSVVDLYNYTSPLLLLLIAAQYQAFDAPVGQQKEASTPAVHPVFEGDTVLIPDNSVPPHVRQIYDDIKRTSDLPFAASSFRAFARWPDFLELYWHTLKAVLESPMYENALYGIRDSAFSLTREFPRVVEFSLTQLIEEGMHEDDIAAAVRITELFLRSLSALVLDVAFAKIAIEGGTRALPHPGGKPEERAA